VNTAAEAMEMPVMAANTALAATVATAQAAADAPEGLVATSKASLPTSAWATRKPVSTNSGTTPKMWLAMASLTACRQQVGRHAVTSSRISHTPMKLSTRPSVMATCMPA
jgi:hypothetical protein